jgi:putative serine protease PepD
LVNDQGQVVGINTASAGQGRAQNIGFAIPIDRARTVLERLRKGGTASTPSAFLGVQTDDPSDGSLGAQVSEVVPGSAAATAGLRAGDVIVSFDSTPVADPGALGGAVRDKAPDDKVEITYRRNGQSHTVTVTLGKPPSA